MPTVNPSNRVSAMSVIAIANTQLEESLSNIACMLRLNIKLVQICIYFICYNLVVNCYRKHQISITLNNIPISKLFLFIFEYLIFSAVKIVYCIHTLDCHCHIYIYKYKHKHEANKCMIVKLIITIAGRSNHKLYI